MPRYKITIEYDGTPFVGWQIQDNGPSVQGLIMAAVAAFTGEKVAVQGAGRTDAGVHALGQVAHFDLKAERDTDTVCDALNAHLRPHPVAVVAAEKVAEIVRRALFRNASGIISIASSIAAPISRSIATAPGASRARSMRRPCTRPRSTWSASTTSPPSAPPSARPSRR